LEKAGHRTRRNAGWHQPQQTGRIVGASFPFLTCSFTQKSRDDPGQYPERQSLV
jgi:hypothetical protein